ERRTQAGELVLHLGRDHRIDGPADQAVALHLPQCLGQHLLTDARHKLADPREAEGSMLGEGFEDEHGPFVGDAPDQVGDQGRDARVDLLGGWGRRVRFCWAARHWDTLFSVRITLLGAYSPKASEAVYRSRKDVHPLETTMTISGDTI